MELRNKVNSMREFDTGYLVVLRKRVKSSRKYGISRKLLFKTKGPYIVLDKSTPSSYWLQSLPFWGGIGRPGRKLKESAASLENIPSTVVLHNHVDGAETIFVTMVGPLANNPLVKWLGVIRRWTYQAVSEDRRWAYDPVSDLWPDIYPDSDSSNDRSSDEGIKDQDNPNYQEQEELVLVPHRNSRRLRRGDQRSLIQLKIYIERSKDKLFFIKHMSAGSTHTKCYLVQVDMDQSNPVFMSNHGVYCC